MSLLARFFTAVLLASTAACGVLRDGGGLIGPGGGDGPIHCVGARCP